MKRGIFTRGVFCALAFSAISALAATYSVTVDYSEGSLYFRISSAGSSSTCYSTQAKVGSDNRTFSVNVRDNNLENRTLTFYSDKWCRTAVSNKGDLLDLFLEPQVHLGIDANKDIFVVDDGNVDPGKQNPPDDPNQPIDPQQPKQPSKNRLVRFFAPWTNTSAIINVAGAEPVTMTKVKNYCGWYEAKIPMPEDGNLLAYFKQTIGYTYVGTGTYEKIDPVAANIFLNLSEVAATSDTIWVKGNKVGAATVTEKFPGIFGECPVKSLAVMMFDWLHGSKGDGITSLEGGKCTSNNRRDSTAVKYCNGAKDRDPELGGGTYAAFQSAFAVSDDFGSGGCANRIPGMVEPILGPNGVPVRAANFPEKCQITEHLDSWFIPQIIGQDAAGTPYTNAACRTIELEMTDEGLWLGQKNKRSPEGGLFLLDDFQYLDEAKTVLNPLYDNLSGNDRKKHNFGFTMKVQAEFEYVPGQKFEFLGDDDVWVFINNRLVVDIGGQHAEETGAVDLDTIGQNDPAAKLIEGQTYPFHIFYAERHTTESNFKMLTSIDLRTEASMLLQNLSQGDILDYEIYQIVRKETLSCDFSGMTVKDTVAAASNFILYGSGAYAEGVALDAVGVWYGGITIKDDFTGFRINPEDIRSSRTLPPGTYHLHVSLRSDESQSEDIWFIVDQYEAPSISYARVTDDGKWTLIGDKVDGIVDSIGKWINTRYPVNVAFSEDWATYDEIVYFKTSNPALVPCDAEGNAISSIQLKGGKASFFVKATSPIDDVTLMVGGQDVTKNWASWEHITLIEPPVPQVVTAFIYDRDGDGRGDSIYAKLSKSLASIDKNTTRLDSVGFTFGQKFPALKTYSVNNSDSSISLVSTEGGFGAVPFTGGSKDIYTGKIIPYWTFSVGGESGMISLAGDLLDSIGPVITSADISYANDGSTQLLLTFSEALSTDNDGDAQYFQYWFRLTGEARDDIAPNVISVESPSTWKLVFSGSNKENQANVPVMGDSVRLIPGVHMDLGNVVAHVNNPYVRIAGEQNINISSPDVVTIGENDSAKVIVNSDSVTVPKIVKTTETLTAKEVADIYGTQGHYLGELSLSSMVKDEVTNIESAVKNFTATSVEKTGLHLEEILAQVESGQISISKADKQYGLGDVIVSAYKNGFVNSKNATGITNGNPSVISTITKEMAEKTTLTYKTTYFTSLGLFVSSDNGSFSCSSSFFDGDCLANGNDGHIYLAWNMRAGGNSDRLVGTGVYIARLEYKITVGNRVVTNRTQDFLWGVRRGNVKEIDIKLK